MHSTVQRARNVYVRGNGLRTEEVVDCDFRWSHGIVKSEFVQGSRPPAADHRLLSSQLEPELALTRSSLDVHHLPYFAIISDSLDPW